MNQPTPTPFTLVERPFAQEGTMKNQVVKEKKDINPAQADSELQLLRHSLGGVQTVQACLFNLIIYAEEECRTDYFLKLQEGIVERFPCRVIFIHCDSNHTNSPLQTHVSVVRKGESGNAITNEKISIEVNPDYLCRVPFLILPMLVPDLPVYLMWGQDPDGDTTILPHLEPYASRVLVDSECTPDLARFATQMRRRLQKCNREVMDFNWARLGGWRRLFTRVFDTREKVEMLRRAKRMTIQYNSKETPSVQHPNIQALFLQAWLAGQLGWEFVTMNRNDGLLEIHYRFQGEPLVITLKPFREEDVPAGALTLIQIASHHDHRIQMERDGSSRHIRVSVSSPERCELPAHYLLSHLTRQQSLLREIFYETPGQHYDKMLSMIELLGPFL